MSLAEWVVLTNYAVAAVSEIAGLWLGWREIRDARTLAMEYQSDPFAEDWWGQLQDTDSRSGVRHSTVVRTPWVIEQILVGQRVRRMWAIGLVVTGVVLGLAGNVTSIFVR